MVLVALAIALVGTARQLAATDGRGPSLDTVALLSRESVGRVLILAAWPLGRFWDRPPTRRTGVDTGHPPVLFLPGYGTQWTVFAFLQLFLGHRGFRWLWAVNHAGRDVELADQARHLHKRILRLKRVTGAEKVDVVGFSMGGVVAAWYVSHGPGKEHVRRLVTIGSPWKGTRIANQAMTPVGRQLRHESPALQGLDPRAVPTVSVWSPDDPTIVPADSAVPAGCSTIRVDRVGHLDQMFNGRVFRAVHRALVEPLAPEAP